MSDTFTTSQGLRITLDQVVGEIMAFIAEDPKRSYKITVGTDSERLADYSASFVSAVVVHRVGNGGRYFWRGFVLGKFHTLRDRIIKEVLLSLELSHELLTKLEEQAMDVPWEFEVHADVGENGPTNDMIQEVVGMIRAHNFEPITKPQSYAASSVADRHV